LTTSLVRFIDQQFTDPAVAAVAGVNPASITNGTTGLVATGNPVVDVPVLIAAFFAGRPDAVSPVLLASPATASALALGKVGVGMPVVTSPYLGTRTIVVDASALALAAVDDLGLTSSQHGSAAVTDTPAPADATTVMRSFFQENLIGLRAEWFISWARADISAVKYSAPA
jgi:hypothetical protein